MASNFFYKILINREWGTLLLCRPLLYDGNDGDKAVCLIKAKTSVKGYVSMFYKSALLAANAPVRLLSTTFIGTPFSIYHIRDLPEYSFLESGHRRKRTQ